MHTEGEAQLLNWERRALLEDIGRIGLTLGREMASHAPAFPSEASVPLSPTLPDSLSGLDAVTPLERLRLLAALWPRIQAALGGILQHPDSRIATKAASILPSQSRGGLPASRSVARTPGGLAAWLSARTDPHAIPSGPVNPEERAGHTHRVGVDGNHETRLRDLHPYSTHATPANRLAATLLSDIEREATALTALAVYCGEDSEAARIELVAQAAHHGRMGTFLRDIPLLAPQERRDLLTTPSLRCAPPYRVLFQLGRTLRQPLGFDWSAEPLLCLPSLPEWNLYEIWCFLKVAAALRSLDWRAVGGDAVHQHADGLRLALTTGRASCLRFARAAASASHTRRKQRSQETSVALIELYYQPLFQSANQTRTLSAAKDTEAASTYTSLSHAMQPDIALRWKDRLYLLDPKYRTYSTPDSIRQDNPTPGKERPLIRQNNALLDDINKMHAYRDAIVTNGRPAVAAGWCLFPGEPQPTASAAIIAYPAGTPQAPFGSAGIGALRLRPGDSDDLLARLLAFWLH